MTASEWNAIPNTSGLELVDGMVHPMAASTARHDEVKDQLRGILTRRVRRRRAGHGLVVSTGIQVRLAPNLRRRPDVVISYRAEPDRQGDAMGARVKPSGVREGVAVGEGARHRGDAVGEEVRPRDEEVRPRDEEVRPSDEGGRPAMAVTAALVLLVVEVVDPGSETVDRRHKPADYAYAGIPHYWRVEPGRQLSVHTYRLGQSGGYLETGLFTHGDRVHDPTLRWASVDVDAL